MYFGIFGCLDDVLREFHIDSVDGRIVFAAYEYEDYFGEAQVIFVRDGKFFHVSGSHCSCYGLEDQWEPAEMPVIALRHIVSEGSGSVLHDHRDGLLRVLDAVETLNLEHASPEVAELAIKLAFE